VCAIVRQPTTTAQRGIMVVVCFVLGFSLLWLRGLYFRRYKLSIHAEVALYLCLMSLVVLAVAAAFAASRRLVKRWLVPRVLAALLISLAVAACKPSISWRGYLQRRNLVVLGLHASRPGSRVKPFYVGTNCASCKPKFRLLRRGRRAGKNLMEPSLTHALVDMAWRTWSGGAANPQALVREIGLIGPSA
jgi:hypothetical protein